MVFGRRKRNDEELAEMPPEEVTLDEEVLDEEVLDETAPPHEDEEDLDQAGTSEDASADDVEADEWDRLDAGRDWREEGPFDIDEVDLDADDVQRLDLGTLVLTPFDEMQLQLQVEQETHQVQAALAMHGQSAIEIALFAAPASESLIGEVRRAMVAATVDGGGQAMLEAGPFGTEIRRVLPLTTPDGDQALHVSRTWFVQGPRWLLRGVLMGDAGMHEGVDGPVTELFDFFRNLVVRRGDAAKVPGDLITMTVPEELLASAEQQPSPEPGQTEA